MVPEEDETHTRIHQHPHGEVNDVRLAANLSEPAGWLSALNARLHGALDDELQAWGSHADEENEDD